MSAALMTTEVLALLRDRRDLAARGVNLVIVEATPQGGVSVGVDGDATAAERTLRGRYPFPVTCWEFAWRCPDGRHLRAGPRRARTRPIRGSSSAAQICATGS